MSTEKDPIAESLMKLAELRKNRNNSYGDISELKGDIILALFGGVPPKIKTAEDFNRFAMLDFIVSKLARYCANFNDTGHDDSLDDISVYCQMLKEKDKNKRKK